MFRFPNHRRHQQSQAASQPLLAKAQAEVQCLQKFTCFSNQFIPPSHHRLVFTVHTSVARETKEWNRQPTERRSTPPAAAAAPTAAASPGVAAASAVQSAQRILTTSAAAAAATLEGPDSRDRASTWSPPGILQPVAGDEGVRTQGPTAHTSKEHEGTLSHLANEDAAPVAAAPRAMSAVRTDGQHGGLPSSSLHRIDRPFPRTASSFAGGGSGGRTVPAAEVGDATAERKQNSSTNPPTLTGSEEKEEANDDNPDVNDLDANGAHGARAAGGEEEGRSEPSERGGDDSDAAAPSAAAAAAATETAKRKSAADMDAKVAEEADSESEGCHEAPAVGSALKDQVGGGAGSRKSSSANTSPNQAVMNGSGKGGAGGSLTAVAAAARGGATAARPRGPSHNQAATTGRGSGCSSAAPGRYVFALRCRAGQ